MIHAKARLRECLLSKRRALTEPEIQQKSAVIAAQVCAMATFCASQTVMVYMALAQEVQTALIIEEALRQCKRVAVPVVRGLTLIAVECPREKAQFRCGPYGILEPRRTSSVIRPEEIQYVVVPGLAFDRRGRRLGFGKGYYDRFLRQVSTTAYSCGLAFCMQIVPCVPRMPHDVCMHGVMTEHGLIPCKHNSACQLGDKLAPERSKGEFR
jgi:5-formyltetrahydrofolate cyclo-ligase